jgi:hypothetical protein
MTYWHMAKVESVLLDRAKAIELGLSSSKESGFYDEGPVA